MTINVELDPKLEERLSTEARARGLAVEIYVLQLLRQAVAQGLGRRARISVEEFQAVLDALASKSPNVQQLRSDNFSRETIYGDHD